MRGISQLQPTSLLHDRIERFARDKPGIKNGLWPKTLVAKQTNGLQFLHSPWRTGHRHLLGLEMAPRNTWEAAAQKTFLKDALPGWGVGWDAPAEGTRSHKSRQHPDLKEPKKVSDFYSILTFNVERGIAYSNLAECLPNR